MHKIVVAQPIGLSEAQKTQLNTLGNVTYYDSRAVSPEEWLARCDGFDVICTGVFGVQTKYQELNNVFISLPFVNTGWVDLNVLQRNNITIANSPGSNRYAVAEWIIGMLLTVTRELPTYLRVEELPFGKMPPASIGLEGKHITILGQGNIGTIVGNVCSAFGGRVNFLKRGGDLATSVIDSDIVIDTLSVNPSTSNLLDEKFFDVLKPKTIFVTVSAGNVVNLDAMFDALDSDKIASVIHDAQIFGSTSDPIYKRLLAHEKVYVTPHIGHNTDVSEFTSNQMMIENIESWFAGKPIHIIGAE